MTDQAVPVFSTTEAWAVVESLVTRMTLTDPETGQQYSPFLMVSVLAPIGIDRWLDKLAWELRDMAAIILYSENNLPLEPRNPNERQIHLMIICKLGLDEGVPQHMLEEVLRRLAKEWMDQSGGEILNSDVQAVDMPKDFKPYFGRGLVCPECGQMHTNWAVKEVPGVGVTMWFCLRCETFHGREQMGFLPPRANRLN